MGFPKALRLIKGEPALCVMAQQFSEAGVQKIFITLPDGLLHDPVLCAELSLLPSQIVRNRFEHLGYAGSILSTLEVQEQYYDGIIICPIDTYANQALIVAMLNLAQSSFQDPLIIQPCFDLKAGHPVYLSRHYFDALKLCHQIGGLRGLIAENPRHLRRLYWPDANILANVNFPVGHPHTNF